MSREQKLINICFELVMTARDWNDFQFKSYEDLAEWVAKNLRGCGFDTEPCGSSWGVLKQRTDFPLSRRVEYKRDDNKFIPSEDWGF